MQVKTKNKTKNGDEHMAKGASHGHSHPFHIVEPSPWPVVGSLSVLVLAITAVLYMHGQPLWIVIPGFAMLIFTLVGWWRDVVKESLTTDHTK